MKVTEDLKKYLKNSFIDDVLSKVHRSDIEMTSNYIWGKYVKLNFGDNGEYYLDTFELENWYIHIYISSFDTIEDLTDIAAQKIMEEETSRLYELDPFGECGDSVVCHQLCDWQVLRDEDDNPVQNNLITLVKYAKFIDMSKYGLKTERFENVTTEIPIKNTIKDEIKIGSDFSEICQNLQNYIFGQIKKAQKDAVTDILFGLYTQDWTRPCDYENMTGEEVVKKMHEALQKVQEKYGISDYDLSFGPELPFED